MLNRLKTKGLKIGYDEKSSILDRIDLELAEGELLCLLGLNGAGKSTLVRSLSGLQKILGGDYQLNENPFNSYSTGALARIMSIVLTGQGLSPGMKVHELVALGRLPYTGWAGRLKEADKILVEKALHLTGIHQLRDKRIGEISDGERQKAFIARAITQETPIILLDEPTLHLDILNKLDVFQILKRLCKEGNKTIIFSTHDLELAVKTADKLMVISTESWYDFGSVSQVLENGTIEKAFSKKDGKEIEFENGSIRYKGMDS